MMKLKMNIKMKLRMDKDDMMMRKVTVEKKKKCY